MEENKKNSNIDDTDNFWNNIFRLKMSPGRLLNQVKNYDTLTWVNSARKLAVLVSLFNVWIIIDRPDLWFDMAIVLILAFYIFKGKSIASILAMIYVTLGKGAYIYVSYSEMGFNIGQVIQFIMWIVFMSVFYQAWQVEKAREEKHKED